MQFQQLLHQRDAILRQARLANVAFAYHRLATYAQRIRRAGLHGTVVLRSGDALDGQPWPQLACEQGSPAVLEEHFLEEDVVDLADILAYLDEGEHRNERRFRFEDLESIILPRLRRELEHAGVRVTQPVNSRPRPR